MNLKSVLSATAAAGLFALATAPAHALLVQDAWQLDLNGAGINSLTTGIGHLSLSAGGGTVQQQVDGTGNVFVGAKFTELGQIFSLSYVPENQPGTGDFAVGIPPLYNNQGITFSGIEVKFTGLQGTVTSVSAGGGFTYAFTPGVGSIEVLGVRLDATTALLANLSVVQPSNGSFLNNLGASGAVGDSTLLGLVVPGGAPNVFRDSTGNSFDPFIFGAQAPGLFFNVITHNTIRAGGITGPTLCGFDATAICLTAQVTSDGAADLFRIPEPASLALFGIALAGIGASTRRRKKSAKQ